ncbi:2-dehydro-3-deoxyphosphogluconate aldolase [Spiroplasma chinense]|uniref:2-dehydro-3-deoxyphosphogluconate aldolase n=1 Tax=Spiroplasma chinense TaxID=216932 RepID=A0A5B9Y2Y5_9MOLU|nr:bifunctional 4-hydroxy-2-oxoglutarate aldolase/2-dehydro-3-deoxy-phosphogluconate aldolase [Spiroplasma chinense]QEH61438.1 2-dehydro-3-deoxyphosphogluconate aldolase [Spiroplasma chinense]
MSEIQKHIEKLEKHKISTIIRTDDFDHAYNIVKASNEAGIKFVEITLTIPNALELIKKCSIDFPELSVGAGTVITMEDAKNSLEYGAEYLVSPIAIPEVVEWAKEQDVLCIAGALTPTEMHTLWKAGADLIKFYPATSMPLDYIKLIHNPMPEYKFLATGGIDYNNILDYINAGCIAAGVTADLGGAAKTVSYEELVTIAKKYVEKVNSIK